MVGRVSSSGFNSPPNLKQKPLEDENNELKQEKMEKKNYQFTQVPTNLFILLDNNCRSMLFTLIQLSSYYADEEGWFFRTCSDLEEESNLSQNLVKATLQTLFNHHIIEAKPTGFGKGKKPNYYKVNFEEFSKYDDISIDEAMKNPDLKIRTVDYKGSCFKLNLVREPVTETVNKTVTTTVTTTVKSDHNIDNIENIYNIENVKNEENIERDISKDEIEKKKEFETACGIEEEMKTELDEVGISDENDFNWKDEIIRFQAKVGRTNTKEELLNISRDFNQKMNDFNYPRELEKELETIKRVVNSRMYSLSM